MSKNLANNERKYDITYTNNTGKYLLIYIYCDGNNATTPFYINDILVTYFNGYHRPAGGCLVVPPNCKYKLGSNGASIIGWYEIS